ncbi:hypothetical protein BGX26_000934, partial [Mortierella sp. AD094]
MDDHFDEEEDEFYDGNYYDERPLDDHQMLSDETDEYESDVGYDGPSVRRSPTLSTQLSKRIYSGGLDLSDCPSFAQDQLCGGSYEILEPSANLNTTTPTVSSRREGGIRHGKRVHSKTPSPPLPLEEQQPPPLNVMPPSFRRSISSPQLLSSHSSSSRTSAPQPRALHQSTPLRPLQPTLLSPPQRGQSIASFNDFREQQAYSRSVSSKSVSSSRSVVRPVSSDSPSNSLRPRDAHSSQPESPFVQRRLSQPPASPSCSRARSQPFHDAASDPSPFVTDTADSEENSLETRRQLVRGSHKAPEGWYELYEYFPLGTIPNPEQCSDAPPTQIMLAKVPKTRTWRKCSLMGHFYKSISTTLFECQVVRDNGEICGVTYAKSGGGGAKKLHVVNQH